MADSTRALTILLGILTTIMIGWVLHVGASIVQPLVIALLLASMLQPVVRQAARWKIPPALTVILIITLFFFGMARLGILVQTNLLAFVGDAPASTQAEDLDPLSDDQMRRAEELGGWGGVVANIEARMRASDLPEPLADYIVQSIEKADLEGLAAGLIGSGFDFTKALLLVVIYMLFIFAEQAVFRRKILSIAGDRREDAATVLNTIGRGIQRYLGVKTVVSLATGLLCYGVLLGLEIPYALLFGFVTFLLNYIPTFGSIIAGTLPTITALAVEASWTKAVAVMVTYLAVNLSLGSYVEPKILGRELNLSPLVIIVSVVVWAGLWGVVGTFLAVPITATMQIILASNEQTRTIAVMLSSGPPRSQRRRR